MRHRIIQAAEGHQTIEVDTPSEYQERLVAFIDILGFKNLVKRSQTDRRVLNALWSVIATTQLDSILHYEIVNTGPGLEISQFSDCIVISAPVGWGYPYQMMGRLLTITGTMLRLHGVLCRGGVTIGPLIHDSNFVFGPAFIEAFELEKRAKVPRILVSQSIMDAVNLNRDSIVERVEREANEADRAKILEANKAILAFGLSTRGLCSISTLA